jgi:hypothetical protein
MMMKKYKIKRSYSRISLNREYDYLHGIVATPICMVDVYSQGSKNSKPHTRIDFVLYGTHYSKTIKKRYTERGLSILANRLVRENHHDH